MKGEGVEAPCCTPHFCRLPFTFLLLPAGPHTSVTTFTVLNVVPAAGFTPRGSFRIATARSVKGTFTTLQLNGRPTEAFTVNSLADGIEVVFK